MATFLPSRLTCWLRRAPQPFAAPKLPSVQKNLPHDRREVKTHHKPDLWFFLRYSSAADLQTRSDVSTGSLSSLRLENSWHLSQRAIWVPRYRHALVPSTSPQPWHFRLSWSALRGLPPPLLMRSSRSRSQMDYFMSPAALAHCKRKPPSRFPVRRPRSSPRTIHGCRGPASASRRTASCRTA